MEVLRVCLLTRGVTYGLLRLINNMYKQNLIFPKFLHLYVHLGGVLMRTSNAPSG